jgi:hypothetical protein
MDPIRLKCRQVNKLHPGHIKAGNNQPRSSNNNRKFHYSVICIYVRQTSASNNNYDTTYIPPHIQGSLLPPGTNNCVLTYFVSLQYTRVFTNIVQHTLYIPQRLLKRKAIPVTGHGGPQGCETLRVPHYLDNRLTDGGKALSLTRRPPFTPPGRFLVLISVRGWVDLQGHSAAGRIRPIEKKSTSSGLEPATFRLVA